MSEKKTQKEHLLDSIRAINKNVPEGNIKLLTRRMLEDDEFHHDFMKLLQILFVLNPSLDRLIAATRVSALIHVISEENRENRENKGKDDAE